MNYRMFDDGRMSFPENYADVYKALSFLKANASAYGLNPNEAVVRWSSAGGLSMLGAATWNDDPGYTRLVRADRDLPEIKWMLLDNTPTLYDRDGINEILWCDTYTWNSLFPYYNLDTVIVGQRAGFDWTEYDTRARVQEDIVKANTTNHIDAKDPAAYFAYNTPLYDGHIGARADCIHSANYGAYAESFFEAAGVPFEMYWGDGGDVAANPSSTADQVAFVQSVLQ